MLTREYKSNPLIKSNNTPTKLDAISQAYILFSAESTLFLEKYTITNNVIYNKLHIAKDDGIFNIQITILTMNSV